MKTRILVLIMVLQAAFTVVVQAQNVTICNDRDFTIKSITPASNGTVGGYRWYENNTLVSTTHTSNTSYTIKAGKPAGTYQYVRQAFATDCQLWQSGNSFTVKVDACTTPAHTIPGLAWTNTQVLASQYDGDAAQYACPSGWRLPTSDELQAMVSAGYTWRAANSGYGNTENGTFFGINSGSCTIADGGCIFFPANGNYWSSTRYYSGQYFALDIYSNSVEAYNGGENFSVLCLQ